MTRVRRATAWLTALFLLSVVTVEPVLAGVEKNAQGKSWQNKGFSRYVKKKTTTGTTSTKRPAGYRKKLVTRKTDAITGKKPAEVAGNVLRVVGRATVTSIDGRIKKITKGTRLKSTDMISTSSRSYVRMKMEDNSYVMVRPDSRLSIDHFKYNKDRDADNKSVFSLLKGGFRAVTGLIKDKRKYRYNTGVATLGIRGTDFSVRVCNSDCYDVDPLPKNGLFLEVHDKEVIITTKAGDFSFTQGQFAYVANSDAPAVLLDTVPEVFDQSAIPSATPDCDN